MGRVVQDILAKAAPVEPQIPEDLDERLVAEARQLGWDHVLHGDIDDAAVYEDFLDGPRACKNREAVMHSAAAATSSVSLSSEHQNDDISSVELNCPIVPATFAPPVESTEPLSPSTGVFHPRTLVGALDLPAAPSQRRRSPLAGNVDIGSGPVSYSSQPIAFQPPPGVHRRVSTLGTNSSGNNP